MVAGDRESSPNTRENLLDTFRQELNDRIAGGYSSSFSKEADLQEKSEEKHQNN